MSDPVQIGNLVTFKKSLFPDKHGQRLKMLRRLNALEVEVVEGYGVPFTVLASHLEAHPDTKRRRHSDAPPAREPVPAGAFDSLPALPDYAPDSDGPSILDAIGDIASSVADTVGDAFSGGGGDFGGSGADGDW